MAGTLSEMTGAELETFRAEAQAQIEALREQFTLAGVELEARRTGEEKARLLAKRQELDQRLAQLEAGQPPAQVVGLKTVDVRAKAVKHG